jgi:uncharacterized protein (TIGR02246 family)
MSSRGCLPGRAVVASRMPNYRVIPIACLVATLAAFPAARAQPSQASDDALKAVLLSRGDEMMAAWKKHDRAGIASVFSPDFIQIGGESMVVDRNTTLDGLMHCDLLSYRIAESSLKRLSPTAAVLITKQEQKITCFGQPAPPVMNMTDTYVKRDGRWLILIHIEAAHTK